jgi:hypothetical protein
MGTYFGLEESTGWATEPRLEAAGFGEFYGRDEDRVHFSVAGIDEPLRVANLQAQLEVLAGDPERAKDTDPDNPWSDLAVERTIPDVPCRDARLEDRFDRRFGDFGVTVKLPSTPPPYGHACRLKVSGTVAYRVRAKGQDRFEDKEKPFTRTIRIRFRSAAECAKRLEAEKRYQADLAKTHERWKWEETLRPWIVPGSIAAAALAGILVFVLTGFFPPKGRDARSQSIVKTNDSQQ